MRPFAKWLLWTGSIATGATGVVYFWMDRMLEPLNEWAVINHPLQPFVLKAHLLVAPVLVFGIGLVATDHIWRYFRGTIRRARRSGLSATWIIVPMIFSGYLVQAVTQEIWLEVVAWVHIGGGAAYLVSLGAHQLAVRRSRLVTLQLRVRPDLVDETEPTTALPGRVPESPVSSPGSTGATSEARRRRRAVR
ncbi:MAG TPA: hypothetical protein VLA09_03745 [Longimicrobiales bacterium]|nr:hypothetical protein [Longimicrobiales bacterium]